MTFSSGLVCGLLLFLVLAVCPETAGAGQKIRFNLPSQRADLSLTAFAKQARLTLIVPFDLVKTKTTNKLVGEYRIEEGIRLLLHGTGLEAEVGDDNRLRISDGQPLGERQNMNDKAAKSVGILALLTSLLGAAPSIANEPTNTSSILEEIVVTAQKREQNLQDVGISITAFTGDQMRELGFQSTTDLVAHTPGLRYVSNFGDGNNAAFSLRGVGLNDFAEINESAVAVYVDEIYHATLAGLGFQLFDIERTEVLKGPQGTLFGRNATGGLVHFVTKKPTDEFEGYIDATYGKYDQVRLEAAAGGPLGEALAARVSVLYHDHDGYRDSRVPGVASANSTDIYSVRGQLLFTPVDNLEILASAHIAQADQVSASYEHSVTTYAPNGASQISAGITDIVDCTLIGLPNVTGTDCLGYRDTDGDVQASDNDREPFLELDTAGVTFNVQYNADAFNVTSITAFEYVDKFFGEDTDAHFYPLFLVTNPVDSKQWTQEIRLHGETGRLNWTTGFYYYYRDIKSGTRTDASPFGIFNNLVVNSQLSNSWALFGHGEYELSENWSFIGGVRVTSEESEYNFLSREELIPGVPDIVFNRATDGDAARHDDTNVSFRAEIDWRPDENMLVYGAISRGVKAAGFNTSLGLGPVTFPYDEETLHAFELGIKSTLLNGTTRFNAAVFYYDYSDYQSFSFAGLTPFVSNQDANVFGFEAELVTNPWEGWEFLFGVSVLDSEAEDVITDIAIGPNAGGIIVNNRDLVLAPDVTFNGLARYEWAMLGGIMSIQGDFSFVGEQYFDINNHPDSREGSYILGNARFAYTSPDDNYEISLAVKNLADEDYRVYNIPLAQFGGFSQNMIGRPRWVSGTIRYMW